MSRQHLSFLNKTLPQRKQALNNLQTSSLLAGTLVKIDWPKCRSVKIGSIWVRYTIFPHKLELSCTNYQPLAHLQVCGTISWKAVVEWYGRAYGLSSTTAKMIYNEHWPVNDGSNHKFLMETEAHKTTWPHTTFLTCRTEEKEQLVSYCLQVSAMLHS